MKTNHHFPSGNQAFSLLELIVVIAIIIFLAGVLAPLVKGSLDDAKVAKLCALVDSVKKAASKYWYDTGALPIERQGALEQHDLFKNPGGSIKNWKGPYLDAPLTTSSNPWGFTIHLDSMLIGDLTTGDGYSLGGSNQTGAGAQLVIDVVPLSLFPKIDAALDGTVSETSGICEYSATMLGSETVSVHIFLFKAQ